MRPIGAILGTLPLMASVLHAQLTADEIARRNSVAQAASEAAEGLSATSEWRDAEAKLIEAGNQCGTQASTQSCRLLVNYSIAYVAQRRGEWDRARTYYQRVLAEAPLNAAALSNLALVEEATGHNSDAESLWNRSIEADPQHAGQWAMHLGDHYVRLGRYADALQQFQVASDKMPEAETPRRRIVDSYVHMPDDALSQLAVRVPDWETSFPSTARIAYELLVRRSFNGPSSDEVLIRWISLIARHDSITKASLALIPPGWKSGPANELRTYVENPTGPAFHWIWWRQTPERISVTLELASAVGKQMLRESRDAGKTASCWETAMTWVSTPDMLMATRSPDGFTTGLSALLDLSQDLASLYYHYPSLDPDGGRLGVLVARLFQGKAMFIEEGDWEATQNYHTTLAVLYADRGIWNPKPGTFFAAGAVYQLESALRDADRRFRDPKQKFFQPLPELKEKLAEGYSQTNQPKRAGSEYLSATAAYLDADALDAAQKTLGKAKELGSPPELTDQLARILRTRLEVSRGASVEISPEKTPWLFKQSETINQDFLKRQTFKISADAAISSAATDGSQADLAVQAYLLAIQEQVPLVGAGDLVRWRRLESNLRTKAKLPESQSPQADRSVAQQSPRNLPLTLPGNWRPAKVPTDPQLSRAVQSMAATK